MITPATWTDITSYLLTAALVSPIAVSVVWLIFFKRPSEEGVARRIRWAARFYWVERWMGGLVALAWVLLMCWLLPTPANDPPLFTQHFWLAVVGGILAMALIPIPVLLFLLELQPKAWFDLDEVSVRTEGKGHVSVHVRPKGAAGSINRSVRDTQNSALPVARFLQAHAPTLRGAGVSAIDLISQDITEEMLEDHDYVIEKLERWFPGWEARVVDPTPVPRGRRWLISKTRKGAEVGEFSRGVQLTWRGTVIHRPRRRRMRKPVS